MTDALERAVDPRFSLASMAVAVAVYALVALVGTALDGGRPLGAGGRA